MSVTHDEIWVDHRNVQVACTFIVMHCKQIQWSPSFRSILTGHIAPGRDELAPLEELLLLLLEE